MIWSHGVSVNPKKHRYLAHGNGCIYDWAQRGIRRPVFPHSYLQITSCLHMHSHLFLSYLRLAELAAAPEVNKPASTILSECVCPSAAVSTPYRPFDAHVSRFINATIIQLLVNTLELAGFSFVQGQT